MSGGTSLSAAPKGPFTSSRWTVPRSALPSRGRTTDTSRAIRRSRSPGSIATSPTPPTWPGSSAARRRATSPSPTISTSRRQCSAQRTCPSTPEETSPVGGLVREGLVRTRRRIIDVYLRARRNDRCSGRRARRRPGHGHRDARHGADARRDEAIHLSLHAAGRRSLAGALRTALRRPPRGRRHARPWHGWPRRAMSSRPRTSGAPTCRRGRGSATAPWAGARTRRVRHRRVAGAAAVVHGQGRHLRRLAGRLRPELPRRHAAAAPGLPVHDRHGPEPLPRGLPHRRHHPAGALQGDGRSLPQPRGQPAAPGGVVRAPDLRRATGRTRTAPGTSPR